MKQKTKTRLASLGLISTSAIGLGCIGFGIYAITQMRHPYLNQWVDFQEEKKYLPIVEPISKEGIAASLHMDVEDLQVQDIYDYYLNKVAVTPEVFVEDFVRRKYEFFIEHSQDDFVWNKYIIRMSDVSLSYEKTENDINYFIHLRWDQDIDGHKMYQNAENKLVAKWAITLDRVPITITKVGEDWGININLATDDWSGTVQIDAVEGFGDQTTCPLTQIDVHSYLDYLKDDYFKNFSFNSHYLSEVGIN